MVIKVNNTKCVRVLQIVPNMQAGGLETLIMNIYRNIDRDKVQFDFLVHYQGDYFYDSEIRSLGGNIFKLSFRDDKNFIKYIRDLAHFFSSHKYDIVHCHMGSTALFTLGMAKIYGVKNRILHSHNSSTENTFKGKVKSYLLKVSKVFSNQYFACGLSAGEFLYGKKEFKIIKNAIDVEKFANAQKRNDPVLNSLEESFVIGHVGRFNEQKNHKFLIEIFSQYYKTNPNSFLVLVGDGELKSEIIKKVEECGLTNSVIFYGTSGNMEEIYKWFNVFVLPSLFEGLPVVGVESQAAGIPCLFSNTISREVGFTDYAKFLPIDCGTDIWVDNLKKAYEGEIKPSTVEDVRKAGYDIKSEAKRVEQIYIDMNQ